MQTEKTNKLFIVLGSIYGGLWQKQLEDSRMYQMTLRIWACEIETLTISELEFGLKKCIKNFEFPPTLPRFVQKCKIEPKDIGINGNWRLSLSNKDLMYDEVEKKISQHNKQKPWWDYEQVFKATYENVLEKKLFKANSNLKTKCDIIHSLIGKQNLLLTAGA